MSGRTFSAELGNFACGHGAIHGKAGFTSAVNVGHVLNACATTTPSIGLFSGNLTHCISCIKSSDQKFLTSLVGKLGVGVISALQITLVPRQALVLMSGAFPAADNALSHARPSLPETCDIFRVVSTIDVPFLPIHTRRMEMEPCHLQVSDMQGTKPLRFSASIIF